MIALWTISSKTCSRSKRRYTNNFYVPLTMTEADQIVFDNATICHICKGPLDEKKVKDHDHSTGKFRGAAHNSCNLNYQVSNKIPVIFHNLKNYDGHLIVQELGKYRTQK